MAFLILFDRSLLQQKQYQRNILLFLLKILKKTKWKTAVSKYKNAYEFAEHH